jgi:hypothetical protein
MMMMLFENLLLQSHHGPRDGPFELNDVFAIINAVPAIALIAYGFFHKGFVPGLCFGAVSSNIDSEWIYLYGREESVIICAYCTNGFSFHALA